jgi:hypothetical protein
MPAASLPARLGPHSSPLTALPQHQHVNGGCSSLGCGTAAAAATSQWAHSPFASAPQQQQGGTSVGGYHEGSDGEVQLHLSADFGRASGFVSMPLPADLDAAAAAAAAPPHMQLPHHPSLASPALPACPASPATRARSDGSEAGGANPAPEPLPHLPALQQRILAQASGGNGDVALLVACARRAQQATPGDPSER